MIVRSATPVSFLVQFTTGHPDANVTWQLYSPSGTLITSGTVTPAVDALSVNIVVGSGFNTLSGGALASYRDILWNYTVGGTVISGEKRYMIEARLPFGVSSEGVRNKLGVSDNDLPDSEISLVQAYLEFEDQVSETLLDAHVLANEVDLTVKDAIEALAAIKLIPSMVVRIANKESSGTNQYQRQKIDWEQIGAYLASLVFAGYGVLIPGYTEITDFGTLFIVASPASDPFTG